MGYGRLWSSASNPSTSDSKPSRDSRSTGKQRFVWACLFIAVFILVASGISVAVVFRSRARSNSLANRSPSQAMARACGLTQYPLLCLNSLLDFPGALEAGERDLVHIAINMTLHRVGMALYGATAISETNMDQLSRTAYNDCIELLGDSIDQLSNSLFVVAPSTSVPLATQARLRGISDEDVLTWLSSALTNHDTCDEGLQQVENRQVKKHMEGHLEDLAELISNSLAIFSGVSRSKDFTGIPIQNKKRRKLLSHVVGEGEFPSWLGKKDRQLLEIPAAEIQADMVVSKNGNGTHTSIAAAVKAAPNYSSRRIIIYIRAGRYNENIKVDRKKTNLMFIGDGKSETVITGSRSVADHFTTFHTATFAATGAGLVMRDLTIENWAGPEKYQAVALRVGADHSVVYRCSIIGFQDTLYVHSQRQFFRECEVYGTVDFVFGNAAVVLQNCTLLARRPLPQQKNTITAQGRKDPNQNTGISFHACRLAETPELEAVRGSFSTYLGRPWRQYSRVVYMMSYMEDHINPAGWLAWNDGFALDTLYYGEYMNVGPGAGVTRRVNWPGFRVITMAEEANKFTVAALISGDSWLPSTGVAFLAGLSVD